MKRITSFILLIIMAFVCSVAQGNIVNAADNSNILVVYFSCSGNTEGIAKNISNILGSDIYEIEAAQPYTSADLNYNNSSSRANKEQNDPDARPEILNAVPNIDKYDAVFIGYPIWWGQTPKIIYTFLESYDDFSGKTIIPFCTSGSSPIGSSAANLHTLASGAQWDNGKRFSGDASESAVKAWTDTLELPKPKIIDDNFVLIKGGTFDMGSPESEPEREADEVLYKITVNDFYMSITEVTQKEYQEIMGSNPSENKGDNFPVENITWYDAVKYCNALRKAKGLTQCYTIDGGNIIWNKNADGYRLPTEAEWEYAARANTSTPFNFGDYVYDENANCYNAYGYNNNVSGSWVNGYLEHTVAVDSYKANSYGLYNMHGNVSKWVWDWYSNYDIINIDNPTGSETGNYKIARGGAWNDFPKHIRSAYRSAVPADMTSYGIGMRLVRSVEKTDSTVKSTFKGGQNKPKKVLIAYFSQTGNTDGLSKIIAEMSGADVFRIERETPYSATHNSQSLYGEALTEQKTNAVPKLSKYLEDEGLNINDYDTILLGYCNWWASIPAPVRSFLVKYDMSGKTIVPFCSMGGGRFGQTISAVAKLSPNSIIKSGLDVTYDDYENIRIEKWLTENGIIGNNEDDNTSILYGEVDNNGKRTATDAAYVLQKVLNEKFILPIENVTSSYMKYADVNIDGVLTASDAAMISQKVLNNDYIMPCESSSTEPTIESRSVNIEN